MICPCFLVQKTHLRKFIIAPAIFVQGRFHQTAQHQQKKVATQRNGAAREHTIFHTTKTTVHQHAIPNRESWKFAIFSLILPRNNNNNNNNRDKKNNQQLQS